MPNVLYRIYKTGDVLYSMRVTLRLSCHMEFREYPLDSQVCGVHVTSYANTDDLVKYRWLADRPIDLPEGLEIAQFELLGFSANATSHAYVTDNAEAFLPHGVSRISSRLPGCGSKSPPLLRKMNVSTQDLTSLGFGGVAASPRYIGVMTHRVSGPY
ncbi:glutamate-gated chloride channel alpha-like [Penaeus monodon]|uniref:glutamate-gated chloride channel alpha-like n=1 Tax=Penaeus monodon TaxID=6687 RepID=UPI0018A7DAAA|nr:glutamate-gated chloride channel alpha-like [Penaeus monodon]